MESPQEIDFSDYTYGHEYACIECPYCNKDNHLEAEDMPWKEDEDREFECEHCEETFTLIADPPETWWKAYKFKEPHAN